MVARQVMTRVIFALVCALIAISVAPVRAETKQEIDLMSVITKMPAMIPILVAKLETQECKQSFTRFKEEADQATAGGSIGKNTVSILKTALCKVPLSCSTEAVNVIKKMVSGGGMMQSLAKNFLESKGIDYDTADMLILGYITNMCSETGEDATANLEEL